MFSHLTNWELSILGLVIAIFTVKPIPLFPDRQPHRFIDTFEVSQYLQPNADYLNWGKMG
jgi:hypothetical protein